MKFSDVGHSAGPAEENLMTEPLTGQWSWRGRRPEQIGASARPGRLQVSIVQSGLWPQSNPGGYLNGGSLQASLGEETERRG